MLDIDKPPGTHRSNVLMGSFAMSLQGSDGILVGLLGEPLANREGRMDGFSRLGHFSSPLSKRLTCYR